MSDFDRRCFSFGGFFDEIGFSLAFEASASSDSVVVAAAAPGVCFITSECLPTTLLKVLGLSPVVLMASALAASVASGFTLLEIEFSSNVFLRRFTGLRRHELCDSSGIDVFRTNPLPLDEGAASEVGEDRSSKAEGSSEGGLGGGWAGG